MSFWRRLFWAFPKLNCKLIVNSSPLESHSTKFYAGQDEAIIFSAKAAAMLMTQPNIHSSFKAWLMQANVVNIDGARCGVVHRVFVRQNFKPLQIAGEVQAGPIRPARLIIA